MVLGLLRSNTFEKSNFKNGFNFGSLKYDQLENRQLLAAATDWRVVSPGGGGSLFAPSINPHNPAEIYIQSDMSQVFRTRDSGASWTTLDFETLGGSSGEQQQFTNNPNIIYSIDYAAIDEQDAAIPVRSNDGGNTWQALTDPTSRETFYLFADYDNPNRVVVSDWTRFYFSQDGGQTWAVKYTANPNDGLHIGGMFFDGLKIYAGTNHGLLVSNDGGGTWQMQTLNGFDSDEDIVTLRGAKENGVVRLYAVAQNTQIWGGYDTSNWWNFSDLYRLDVGQSNWVSIKSNLPSNAKPFFVDLAANDIDTLYIAGSDELGMPVLYKSTNSGAAWSNVFRWQNNENIATGWQGEGGTIYWWWGGGAMGFDVDRANSNNVMVTDLGFAHLTNNGGTTWRNVNVHPDDLNAVGQMTSTTKSYRSSGLGNTGNWTLTWIDRNTVLAGFSDIEYAISYDGGKSWSFDYTGLGQNSLYDSTIHPDTGIVYAATSTIHDLYETTRVADFILDPGQGKVVFSADNGRNWQTLHDFGKIVRSVTLYPANPNRMYAAVVHSTAGGIYVSDNINLGANSTWRKLANPPRTEGHPLNIEILNDGTLVTTYSARRPGNGDPFTASSGVFVSTNQGQSWLDRTDDRMKYWTREIMIDPYDATQNTWYVGVYSGWGGPPNDLGGLYKTTNRGQTWSLVYQAHRVTSATISPTNTDEMYLTTEAKGLIYTPNRNSAQPTFARVEGMNFRQPQHVIFNPYDSTEVWVTTFGGQLWIGSTAAIGGEFQLNSNRLTIDKVRGNSDVTVTQTSSDYVFTLSSGIWQGTDGVGVSGNGSATLRVNRTALNQRPGGLSLRDTSQTNYDLFFSGSVDLTGLSGLLETVSIGNVRQTPGSSLKLRQAKLNALDIVLSEAGNELGWLSLEGKVVDLESRNGLFFWGTNIADNVLVSSPAGPIGTFTESSIRVSNNLQLDIGGRVDLARRKGEVLTIGGGLIVNAAENPVLIGDNGQANFGWLWVGSAGLTRISEKSSTFVSRLKSSNSVYLKSSGAIVDAVQAVIDVRFILDLNAASNMLLADTAESSLIAGSRLVLKAGGNIDVGANGFVNSPQVNFSTPANATLSLDSRIFLYGNNEAANASLVSADSISDAPASRLDIRNSLVLDATQRVFLADSLDNFLTVGGRANIRAGVSAILHAAGNVTLSQLSLTSPFADFSVDSGFRFAGNSNVDRLLVNSSGNIADVIGAELTVSRYARLNAKGIDLADDTNNRLKFCGHVRFEVTDYLYLRPQGLVLIDSWWATPGVLAQVSSDGTCS